MEEKKNLESKNSNKKKTLIIVLIVLAVALIALAIINSSKNKGTDTSNTANTGTDQAATSQTDNNTVAPVSGEVTPNTPANTATSGTPDASGTVSATANTGTPAVGATAGTTGTKEAPIEKTNPVTIKMTIDSTKGFDPASFDVKAGQQVTLTVTANGGVAILVFDGGLSATATGISIGQTKDITFVAPVTRGAYSFHNDIPGKNQTCKINVK
jgi:plastocyanin